MPWVEIDPRTALNNLLAQVKILAVSFLSHAVSIIFSFVLFSIMGRKPPMLH